MIDKKKKDNIIKFPSELSKTEKEIEAILFASEEPLSEKTIEEKINRRGISKFLENLKKQYENRGINLTCISGKWSLELQKSFLI